jgi:hypothetical protein
MNLKTRISAAVACAALALTGAASLATAASAETTACDMAGAGNCGSQVNAFGGPLVIAGPAKAGTPVVSGADSKTTGRADWAAVQTTSYPDERRFEYAPKGVLSGLCISQPSGWSFVVLRPCNATPNQRLLGTDTRNTAGTQWQVKASGGFVTGAGTGNAFAVVKTVKNKAGSYFGFDAPGVVPAPAS